MVTLPPEKLGSFYLGAAYDIKDKCILGESVNYDARDLTTHAVCVGMTGSGKTGLCIGLLEEAAIDKVPAIIIDPKGDMTNLLLQFECLDPSDFDKWVNADDAGRKGMTTKEYAAAIAAKWKNGLADWGQGQERIEQLKNAVDYTIYTPGSDAGIPINILGSFAAPGINFDEDAEMLRERIQGTVAALLGMVESKADPVRSREGILLSTLFEHYWRLNQNLDLATLIQSIMKPPIKQLGVFDVDTFFPEKDRFELAMDFNTLIASPQFRYWLQGDALDIDQIYFTKEGKPRHSIFYIAHLSESERMFFVTLLLNSLITWMRKQSGTTSLRSLLYFDEIFGYFPPTAQPPSKKPLLTILKQARAFGVGAVLVTQNPVDIDYKGLSNAGTWFIGKLQTDKDKERVLSGLEGAIAEAGASEATDFGKLISALSSRVFLMHNVHDAQPVVYHTRWVMSYLRGPMTRPQLKELMKAKKEARAKTVLSAKGKGQGAEAEYKESDENMVIQKVIAAKPAMPKLGGDSIVEKVANTPPAVSPSVEQRFFSIWKSAAEAERDLGRKGQVSLVYEPVILTAGKVRFYDSKRNIDVVEDRSYLSLAPDDFGRTNWELAEEVCDWENALLNQPDNPEGIAIRYEAVADTMNTAKELGKVKKSFSDWLYQTQRFLNLEHEDLKLYKKSNESDQAFRMRVQQVARELRDEELDELQDKYEVKLDKINERIRKEENELAEAEAEASSRKKAEWIGMAETFVSIFVRRRSRSLNANSTKSRMSKKAALKVKASQEELVELEKDFTEMETELKGKLDEIRQKWDTVAEGITSREIKPRRADVKVDSVILTWEPYWESDKGQRVSARG